MGHRIEDHFPAAFHSATPDDLPIKIRFYRVDNDEQVHEIEITELPVTVRVPPLAEEHGCPVWVAVETADGTVDEARPNNEGEGT
jgi:hypothetical protein